MLNALLKTNAFAVHLFPFRMTDKSSIRAYSATCVRDSDNVRFEDQSKIIYSILNEFRYPETSTEMSRRIGSNEKSIFIMEKIREIIEAQCNSLLLVCCSSSS